MNTTDIFKKPKDQTTDTSTKDHENTHPLADRIRPATFDDFVGQDHIIGKEKILRKMIETDKLSSMIFWGPPGCGKTTLAYIISHQSSAEFKTLSAVVAGKSDVKEIIDEAKMKKARYGIKTILFVDEIHRFNKAQQDAFLPFVEDGTIILIGATTENPSFEIISPLLSRTKLFVLNRLDDDAILDILKRSIEDETKGLAKMSPHVSEDLLRKIICICEGDARSALNTLEIAVINTKPDEKGNRILTEEIIIDAAQKRIPVYDKAGEEHYNLISALHKSLRGSDPDAALYWLARMIESGEDPLYIARRMVRFASEDVGMADPNALVIANAAKDAVHFIGLPEGNLALAQAAIYLATAPKSNALYTAYGQAQKDVNDQPNLPVPLRIRNAPTSMMEGLGYGKDYKYPHDYEDTITKQDYLPDNIRGRVYYRPTDRGFESEI
ncbi:replication-associated recombination protein A, partial [bacterium]|nr:replication-associated recombination protein A [bacterium]